MNIKLGMDNNKSFSLLLKLNSFESNRNENKKMIPLNMLIPKAERPVNFQTKERVG